MDPTTIEGDFQGHIYMQSIQDKNEKSPRGEDPLTLSAALLIGNETIDSQKPRMQALWEEVSSNELKVPYKYQNVSALIVHWAKYLDEDLHCEAEAKELHEVFRKGFNFKSTILTLDDNREPQRQIRHALDQLVLENNGPCRSNLFIIYYSGHGTKLPDKGLYITAKENYNPSNCPTLRHAYPPYASWKEAEDILTGTSADILSIIDSCYAGAIWKNTTSEDRSWEVLAASNREDPAYAPGPKSFTRALIDSLRARLDSDPDQLFSVWQLHDDIMKRRNDERSVFRTRHGVNDRYIKLARLDKARSEEDPAVYTRERAYMTLRLSFVDRSVPSDDELKKLAMLVSQGAAKADLGIKKIDMIEFREQDGDRLAGLVQLFGAVRKAQRLYRGRMARNRLREQRDGMGAADGETSRLGSKRGRDDGSQSGSPVKRGRTGSTLSPDGLPSPSPSTGTTVEGL